MNDQVDTLDIAENGSVVATWTSGGIRKVVEVPVENMVFFLDLQEDRVRLGIPDEPGEPRKPKANVADIPVPDSVGGD